MPGSVATLPSSMLCSPMRAMRLNTSPRPSKKRCRDDESQCQTPIHKAAKLPNTMLRSPTLSYPSASTKSVTLGSQDTPSDWIFDDVAFDEGEIGKEEELEIDDSVDDEDADMICIDCVGCYYFESFGRHA